MIVFRTPEWAFPFWDVTSNSNWRFVRFASMLCVFYINTLRKLKCLICVYIDVCTLGCFIWLTTCVNTGDGHNTASYGDHRLSWKRFLLGKVLSAHTPNTNKVDSEIMFQQRMGWNWMYISKWKLWRIDEFNVQLWKTICMKYVDLFVAVQVWCYIGAKGCCRWTGPRLVP